MEIVKTCGVEIDFDKQDGFFINADCVEGMKAFPDNYFDLAITDPPYGAGFTEGGGCQGWFSKYHQQPELTTNKRLRFHGSNVNPNDQWYKYTHDEDGNEKIISWDVAPDKTYFDELFRVSKNQIIWGGNYFDLPPTRCFLIWKKLTISESFSMAMAEYAWTSFNDNAKVFECAPQGKPGDSRFHPCLPEGELVRFNGEWKKIDSVEIGDRCEFGKVQAITTHYAEKIIEIDTIEGNTTKATWNHPFLVMRDDEIAWINAELLKGGDKILCLKNTKPQEKVICDIEQMGRDCEWNIALYGKNTLEKSQMVCRFITLMGTRPITTFPICNLLRPLNTSGYTKVASLKMENGISHVNVAASIKKCVRKIGTLIKRLIISPHHTVSHVISKKESKIVDVEWQTVGNIKTIQRKQKVYNLTIDGIPAFETKVGISHNTQKPIALYEWILNRYAKDGDIILDTHVGSASSLVACRNTNHKYVGFEIDEDYYKKAKARLDRETAQMNIWDYMEKK